MGRVHASRRGVADGCRLRVAADYFAAAIGGRAAADLAGFVVARIVYFAIVGLMTGYLGTRVLLAPLFKLADKGLKTHREGA